MAACVDGPGLDNFLAGNDEHFGLFARRGGQPAQPLQGHKKYGSGGSIELCCHVLRRGDVLDPHYNVMGVAKAALEDFGRSISPTTWGRKNIRVSTAISARA